MKILHTADIHLRAAGDDRWNALEAILDVARRQSVALIVVSGDMFDRRIDAQTLKVPLRDLLQDSPTPILILPGNHDVSALTDGDYYGENVRVIGGTGGPIDVGDVRVFGLPFERVAETKVVERLFGLRKNLRPDACNILAYHGELMDLAYAGGSFGEEEDGGYMPVRLSFFDRMGFDYVLAGHYHTNFEVLQYEGGYFVYPGSPVPVTRKEIGVRRVNLFEVGKPPQAVALDCPYYEDVRVVLDPFSDVDPLTQIRHRIETCPDRARILLTVDGFVDLAAADQTESEFGAEIEAIEHPRVERILSHWTDIGAVLGNELYKRFNRKLEGSDLVDDRRSAVRQLVIEGMMEALHAD
jgi:exonuclease SbcD